MVTWGRAWKAVLEWLAYTVVWGLVGFVFIGIGFLIIGASFSFNPISDLTSMFAGDAVGVISIMIGIAITALGALASFFKVNSEITAEEVNA